MHEIVTIQLGGQANYLATHFWNAQESYFTYSTLEDSPVDHDVHFRPGVGVDGADTFTPRTLIYDLKRNFGTMRRVNELYEAPGEPTNASLWGGATVTHREQTLPSSTYQAALADNQEPDAPTVQSVRYWSDYSRTYFHPRSAVQISEADLDLGARGFDAWEVGAELHRALNGQDDMVDRDLRPFAEECDQMQGIQIFAGVDDAWAGFAGAYLDRLRDDYGKTTMWVWGLAKHSTDMTLAVRMTSAFNQARAALELSAQASMYVPVAAAPRRPPSYISFDSRHPWHTSALQQAGVESVLLPTRLRRSGGAGGAWTSLDALAATLAGREDRRIARLAFKVESGVEAAAVHTNGHTPDSGVPNGTDTNPPPALISNESWCDLFPRVASDDVTGDGQDQTFAEVECRRGDMDDKDDVSASSPGRVEAFRMDYRRASFDTALAMPLPSSFPRIFARRRGQDTTTTTSRTASTAVRSSLAVSSATGRWAGALAAAARRGAPPEEREELVHGLACLREAYAADMDDFDGEDGDGGWDD